MRSHPAVSVSDRCSKVLGHNAMMSQRFRAGWGCCEAFLDIWWPTSKNASYEHTSVITTLPTSLGDLSLIRLAAVRSTKAKCPNCRLQDSRRPKQVVLNVWPRDIDQIWSDLVGMSQLRCNLKGFLSTPIFTPDLNNLDLLIALELSEISTCNSILAIIGQDDKMFKWRFKPNLIIITFWAEC